MGFLDVFMMWSVFSIIIGLILFSVFSYVLGLVYTSSNLDTESSSVSLSTHTENGATQTTISKIEPLYISNENNQTALDGFSIQQRRKLIGIFVLVAIIAIMATSGINAFMNTR